MLRLHPIAALVILTAAPPVYAAEPTIEIRAQSLNDLIDKFEYLGDLIDQREAGKQAAALAKAFTDPKKGLEGFDPSRPAGLYAVVTPAVVDSQVVAMLPIADERTVLALLKDKLKLDPNESEGVYELRLPNVPVTVYFRFANEYLYATVVSASGIDPSKLIAPKPFFPEKLPAIIATRLYIDRIPEEVKKTVFGQFELRIAEAKEKQQPGETPAQAQLRVLALDLMADAFLRLLDDGTLATSEVVIEPQSDELRLEVGLSARSGSPLAKSLSAAATPSRAARFAMNANDPTFAVAINAALPERYRNRFADIVDRAVAEGIENADQDGKEVARTILQAFVPTAKAAIAEAGIVLTGPAKPRSANLTAAVRATDTAGIDKALRQLEIMIPASIIDIELDRKAAPGLSVHQFTPTDAADLVAVFGAKSIWFGTAENLFLIGMGKESKGLDAAADAPAQSTPPFFLAASISRLALIFDKQLGRDQIKTIQTQVLGDTPKVGADSVRLETIAGNPMSVRLVVKGTAVKFLVALDKAKKETVAESTSSP